MFKTGVENKLENGLRVSVDWLGFTIFNANSPLEVIELLGYKEEDFTQLPKGGMGYKSILQLNGYTLQILYDGKEDMGIHVNIGGSSIVEVVKTFMETKKIDTPFGDYAYDTYDTALIAFLKEISTCARFTRVDLAVDDLGANYYKLDELSKILEKKDEEHRVVSKFRNWQEICKKKLTGEKTGQTIYMGSRKSETFLRVYDKRLEQMNKSGGDVGIDWIRWELELKKDRAEETIKCIVERGEIGSVFTGILNNYVRIVEDVDSNVSRCPSTALWNKFVSTVEKIRLYAAQAEKTLEDKMNWFKTQVAPTLAGIVVANQGDMGIVYDYFDTYLQRMSKDMRTICDKYNPTWRDDWGFYNEFVA